MGIRRILLAALSLAFTWATAQAQTTGECGSGACAPACETCGSYDSCDSCDSCCDLGPRRLLTTDWMAANNITFAGWVNAGYTWNPDNPANGYNVPVTFQDRANEGRLQQLYTYAQKSLDTSGGFDIGGRVDLLYGTDYYYTTALGLETERDGTQRWNKDDFNDPVRFAAQYGLAMPQLYAEVGAGDIAVKLGHFYAPVGYQSVMAPYNFFVTQPYTFQYGEPFTLTGALATVRWNDNLSLLGGVHRGWDKWEDDNDSLGGILGFNWLSDSGNLNVAWTGNSSDEGSTNSSFFSFPGGNRLLSSLVISYRLSDRWQYVWQNDIGWQDDAARAPFGGPIVDSEWYGINQYLFYALNDRWTLGGRFEWFRDDDGTRVRFFDYLSDNEGNWFETALGVNYRPGTNVTVRSECRWDWTDAKIPPENGTGFPGNIYPYDTLSDGHQFLWANDLIVLF